MPSRQREHPEAKVRDVWNKLNDPNLPPNVTEDPLFKTVYGYVASASQPPRLTEAREAFGYAQRMGLEPEFNYLTAWFNAEKKSGMRDAWCDKISDIVASGKKYTEAEKIGMISRKASNLYVRGRDLIYTDYQDAIRMFYEALSLHLKAFRLNCINADAYASVSEKYARNTAFSLFTHTAHRDAPWEVFDQLTALGNLKDIYLDPIEDPLREAIGNVLAYARRPEVINRVRQKLKSLPDLLAVREQWLESENSRRVIALLKTLDERLAEAVVRR